MRSVSLDGLHYDEEKTPRNYYNGPLHGLWTRAEPRQIHMINPSTARTLRTDELEEANIHFEQKQRYTFESCRTIHASLRT